MLFDPELVGFMLRTALGPRYPGGDFQDLDAWRRLVPSVAAEISVTTASELVAMQSVTRQDYWSELVAGMADRGLKVFHVLLDATTDALHERIKRDKNEPRQARQWRHDHVAIYESARSWMVECADLVIDTTTTAASVVAEQILAAVVVSP